MPFSKTVFEINVFVCARDILFYLHMTNVLCFSVSMQLQDDKNALSCLKMLSTTILYSNLLLLLHLSNEMMEKTLRQYIALQPNSSLTQKPSSETFNFFEETLKASGSKSALHVLKSHLDNSALGLFGNACR